MPNLADVFRGAAGGAAAGSPFGPWGAGIGAVGGAIAGAFSDSPEDERQKRRTELLGRIAQYRQQSLQRGTELLNKNTAGQMANVRQAAARRALSMGRSGDAESFINPAQEQVSEQGSANLEKFITGTNQYYDQAELSAETDFAGRPIQPNLTDVVESLGVAGLQYKGAQDRIDAMKEIYGTPKGVDTSGAATGAQASTRANLQAPTFDQGPVSTEDLPATPTSLGPMFPQQQSWIQRPRKPTNMSDMYSYLMTGR